MKLFMLFLKIIQDMEKDNQEEDLRSINKGKKQNKTRSVLYFESLFLKS